MHDTPKNAPPTYVEAVQRLHKVFETAAKRTENTTAPPLKHQRVRVREIKPAQQQLCNTPLLKPKSSIPKVSDDEYSDAEDSDDESIIGNNSHIDAPIPAQYNLRMRATNIIKLLIVEESPNVTNKTTEPVHQGQFSLAVKYLQLNKMCTPFNMFASAVIDEETGKAM
eukprot:7821112-Ditylum_brightwellii.AAC.1